MITYFNLPPNYNFKTDVKNTRLRNNQKEYNKYILQTNSQGDNRIVQYINSNTPQIIKGDISNIFKYINDISGYIAIGYDHYNLIVKDSMSGLFKYIIQNNDLEKKKKRIM
jgi:hypothetical protein